MSICPWSLRAFLARLVLSILAVVGTVTSGAAAGVLVEELQLPAQFKGQPGGKPTMLQAALVHPDDGKRHPLVLVSHGSPRDPADRAKMSPKDWLPLCEEFAKRGFTAVIVMRRGYGASDGPHVEGMGECASPRYEAASRDSAADIREAIRLLRDNPFVDASTIISVGRSAGGLGTVALTADAPQGLKAAISFAGGRGSTAPDKVCDEASLVRAFATLGKTSRVPMLWVYSENDHFFGPNLAKRFHKAFTDAGGQAEFILAPPFGEDGHKLFSTKGIPQWTPLVDAFLKKQGLLPAAAK